MKNILNRSTPLFLLLSLATVFTFGCTEMRARRTAMTKLPPPLSAPTSQDEKMAWFREAKFGLFIHWGLYCIPAGEWDGKRIPGLGEWIMHNTPIPVTQY